MLRGIFLFFVLLCYAFILAGHAQAKEGKYDRKKKKAPAVEQGLSQPPTGSAAKPEDAKPSEKVDISDLENRYWAPKDTEFSVVQNRLYTKAKRFSVAPSYGPLLNDPYNASAHLGIVGNYYFSERQGVELQAFSTPSTDSDLVQTFREKNGVTPDFNKPHWYIGVGYNWVPIYAKLSLLEKKILYFDMFVTVGLGLTNLEANRYTGSGPGNTATVAGNTQNCPTLALDLGQQVFLSEHWALRMDLRNHIYREKVFTASTGDFNREKTTYSGAAMLSITYFH